jgi:hypothetical protein
VATKEGETSIEIQKKIKILFIGKNEFLEDFQSCRHKNEGAGRF